MSALKLKTQVWGAANGLMFSVSVKTKIQFEDLVLDGNKGNVGTTRSPLIVLFNSQRILVLGCIFQNCEGICLNTSTNIDDIQVRNCQFLSCGGDPSNSDGYRNQAITFTSPPDTNRSANVYVTGCYFYRQGLDCISLADCDNVVISGNISLESYTLVYNNESPRFSTNVVIANNVVRLCSEFGAATAVPPVAFDLPSVIGAVIIGNSLYDVDSAGIGVFANSKNVVVSGNTITNPMRASTVFKAGIFVSLGVDNVSIYGNLITDTAVTPLMSHGVVVGSTATNILVKGNIVKNPLVSRMGYYTTIPSTTFAFTSTTQVSSSSRIVDLDVGTNTETTNGFLNVAVTDNTRPAVRITQLGTANAFEVYDEASDNTPFMVDSDGDVGIRISSAVFGGPLSVSGTGSTNNVAAQAFGNDNNQLRLQGFKTRATNAYGQGLLLANDLIFRVEARGSDGVDYRQAAYMQLQVEGTPAANSMPGRIAFGTTPTSSVTPIERLVIKQAGAVRFLPMAQPAAAEAGDTYYDSTTNKLRTYNGTAWFDLF